MINEFTIHISQEILDNLKERLGRSRFFSGIPNTESTYGINQEYLKELCNYWEQSFDWRKQEIQLNSFPQYSTLIDDVSIHFLLVKGKGKNPLPILLTHGFPDSFVRFLKLIPLLTCEDNNGLSFDVIVPSIPGYGFSEIPKSAGMNPKKIAGLFDQLMTKELGYDKYFAHGGDWGSSITEQLALYHPESLLAIHLTDVPFAHSMFPLKDPDREEKSFFKEIENWQQTQGAYALIQSTKPQTLALGLNDSPAGLAGWIIEKFQSWSDCHGKLENCFTKDELLTNLTIYWATETINSAMQLYYEAIQAIMNAKYNPLVKLNPFDKTGKKITVPTGFALFPKDISKPPRHFAERFFNVVRWTEMESGGHFAAMEQPRLLSKDIRQFITGTKEEGPTAANPIAIKQ